MTGTATTGKAPAISFNRVEYAQKCLFKPTRASYSSKASRASPGLALPLNTEQQKRFILISLTAASSQPPD